MSHDPATTRPITFRTSDGLDLEGELAVAEAPRLAAVVTHPHPLHGGNMTSLVTGSVFKALAGAGHAVLRFNFRGVEGSSGSHDEGRGERLDVTAAIDTLTAEVPDETPLIVAGWSFGADVALAVDHRRLRGWFVVAAPLRTVPLDEVVAGRVAKPKLFAVPEHDQFRTPEGVREIVGDWPDTSIEVVPGADHFLVGRTDMVERLAVEFAAQF